MKTIQILTLSLSLLFVSFSSLTAQRSWSELNQQGKERIFGIQHTGLYTFVLTDKALYNSSNMKDFYKLSNLPALNPHQSRPGDNSLVKEYKFIMTGPNIYVIVDSYVSNFISHNGASSSSVELRGQTVFVSKDLGKTWQQPNIPQDGTKGNYINDIVYGRSNSSRAPQYWAIHKTTGKIYRSNDGASFNAYGAKTSSTGNLFAIDNAIVVAGDKLWSVYHGNGQGATATATVKLIADLPNYTCYPEGPDKNVTKPLVGLNVQHPDNPKKIIGYGYHIILGNPLSTSGHKIQSYGMGGLKPTGYRLPSITSNHYYQEGNRRVRLQGGSDNSRMFQFDAAFESVNGYVAFTIRKGSTWYAFGHNGTVRTLNGDQITSVNTSAWKLHNTGSATVPTISNPTIQSPKPTITRPKTKMKKIGQ